MSEALIISATKRKREKETTRTRGKYVVNHPGHE